MKVTKTDRRYGEKYLDAYYGGHAPRHLRAFQRAIGMGESGRLCPVALRAMKTLPRCGCRDAALLQTAAALVRWATGELTWYVDHFVNGLEEAAQEEVFAAGWASWEQVAGVTLERVERKRDANLVISAGRGRRSGFDGPGNVLAWAFLPESDEHTAQLEMRFDLAELWRLEGDRAGILLVNVAAHEFGHLLGLDHSAERGALMAPFYNPEVGRPQANDDIPRIQQLYGAPLRPTEPPAVVHEVTVRAAEIQELLINEQPIELPRLERWRLGPAGTR